MRRLKKKLAALLLTAVLLAGLVCSAAAAGGEMFFVAVNDTIPLTLTNGKPTYTANGLIVPYTVFDASPGGVVTGYDFDAQTLVLFTRDKRLVFDLDQDKVTDENGKVSDVKTSYKNGVLYIPASFCAQHFGQKVTLLTSRSGYSVLRFTNGSEAYDDTQFLEKAESLISYRVQTHEQEQSGNPSGSTSDETAKEEETPEEEIDIYPAFVNAEQMPEAAELLKKRGEKAAFFLTAAEITENADLVRSLYAAGHQIGLTVSREEKDAAAALSAANDALRAVLHRKTLMVLLTAAQAEGLDGYCVFERPTREQSARELVKQLGGRLLLCTENPQSILDNIDYAGATVALLRETSFLNE